MKYIILFFLFFIITNCSNNKSVYWCGDHACINKKEKEDYFKKTMIVEKKIINEKTKNKSEINKIIEQAKLEQKKKIKDEKDILKKNKFNEKMKAKSEKELAKQAKLEEKRKIKEEKKLAKLAKIEQKKRLKEEKKLDKKNISNSQRMVLKESSNTIINENSKFNEILKMIREKNASKDFPDINNLPE